MKHMKTSFFYLIAGLLFITASCSKDDDASAEEPIIPTNLTSILSTESNAILVNEGRPMIINLNLSKAFSEDLILEGEFKNVSESSYMNDDDLKKEFEYSIDGGINWLSELNKLLIKFPKGKQSLKVRIQTNDDDDREILLEETVLSFIKKTPDLDIGEEDLNINLSIKDNDDPQDTDEDALMQFVFDDNNNYSLEAITNTTALSNNPNVKEIIDGGYTQIMDDIQYANSLLPQDNKIKKFFLLFNDSGVGGYVFNDDSDPAIDGNINSWFMAMNLTFAYTNFPDPEESSPPTPIAYNENGVYGFILAHEVGHIITLARKRQLDSTIEEEKDCENFFVFEGCLKPDAHLNKFYNSFYDPTATEYEEPKYVSQYAETNIVEDIAEVIGTYVTQENLPALNDKSSGALHKLYQLFGADEFISFRENFRKKINVGFGLGTFEIEKSSPSNQEVIFNKFNEKRVPCSQLRTAIRTEKL